MRSMTTFLIAAGLTLAYVILRIFLRGGLRVSLGRGQRLGSSPGQLARANARMAATTDAIQLVASDRPFTKPASAQLIEELKAARFEDAGAFAVTPMRDVYVKLLVSPPESISANVYDHRVAGVWLELVTRYADGSTFSVSNREASGLAPLARHREEHIPGARAADLVARMRATRPQGEVIPVTAPDAARMFEQGYQTAMAERKGQSLTAAEINRVHRPMKRG